MVTQTVGAQAGTARALLNSMVIGATEGFTTAALLGVGYRAAVVRNVVNLSLGFLSLVDHQLPAGGHCRNVRLKLKSC